MSHVIGQYLGSRERFRVVSGGSEVTIQFQSDPDDSTFILSQGFLIHYRGKYIKRVVPFSYVLCYCLLWCHFLSFLAEVEPNDTCPALPQIEFGWSSSSHPSLVRGSVLTYQCQPGYDIVGSDIITCQWDLSWSNNPPTCVKSEPSYDYIFMAREHIRVLNSSLIMFTVMVVHRLVASYLPVSLID